MATTLGLTTAVTFIGDYETDADLESVVAAIRKVYSFEYANGTGSSQANTIWSDTVAVTTSPTSYDLTSGMTDRYGTALTFATIKEIFVYNRSTTGSDYVRMGGNVNSSLSPFTTGDYIVVYGGGSFHWRSPITGFTVVNSTNDALTLLGSTSLNVDLILVGTR